MLSQVARCPHRQCCPDSRSTRVHTQYGPQYICRRCRAPWSIGSGVADRLNERTAGLEGCMGVGSVTGEYLFAGCHLCLGSNRLRHGIAQHQEDQPGQGGGEEEASGRRGDSPGRRCEGRGRVIESTKKSKRVAEYNQELIITSTLRWIGSECREWETALRLWVKYIRKRTP